MTLTPRSVTPIFWMMTLGALGLVLGPWFSSKAFTVPGLILHLSATIWLLLNVVKPLWGDRQAWSQPGLWHLVTAYFWILAPVLVAPAQLGADVVVHSMTKFLSGASDLIAGAVCGTADFVRSMMDVHTGALMLLGPTLDPRIAFQLSVRLPHLGLRMREHSHRAMTFAVRLRELGLDVRYPGLESHPQHALMQRMLTDEEFGFGGVLGLNVPDPEVANRLLDELQNREKFGWIAVSLGYFDTLMSVSAASTSSELGSAELKAAGIKPGYVRISVGFTGTLEQRWLQFEHALRRVGLIGASSGPRLVR